MPWQFQLDRYLMECRLVEQPRGTTVITVVEKRREIHCETLQIQPQEDAVMFHGRVWGRVWELQDHFRPRAQQGLQREWERQAREG